MEFLQNIFIQNKCCKLIKKLLNVKIKESNICMVLFISFYYLNNKVDQFYSLKTFIFKRIVTFV